MKQNHHSSKIFLPLLFYLLLFQIGTTKAQDLCENANPGSSGSFFFWGGQFMGVQANNDCTFNIKFGRTLTVEPACFQEGAFSEQCQNGMLSCFGNCYQYRLFLDNVEIAEVCTDNGSYTFTNVPWQEGVYKCTIQYRHARNCGQTATCIAIVETAQVDFTNGNDCGAVIANHVQGDPANVHKEGPIRLICPLAFGTESEIKSATSVCLENGFEVGAGGNGVFEAGVSDCPPMLGVNTTPDEADYGTALSNSLADDTGIALVDFQAKVVPNPNHGDFNLQLDGYDFSSPLLIRVTDLSGKLLSESFASSNRERLELTHLENGIYLIQLLYNNQKQVLRFSKQ